MPGATRESQRRRHEHEEHGTGMVPAPARIDPDEGRVRGADIEGAQAEGAEIADRQPVPAQNPDGEHDSQEHCDAEHDRAQHPQDPTDPLGLLVDARLLRDRHRGSLTDLSDRRAHP